jgi:hypothetical protein
MQMNLREIKKSVRALSSRQLIKLDAWLHELIDAAESKKRSRASGGRQVLEEHKTVNKTYRLEEVRCGKKNCHCAEGRLHGPYWYAYWTEGGRTKSQYVGKKLPKGVKRAKT